MGLDADRYDVPSLTLTLQESQDVLLTDGALHVTDDRPAGVVHELDTDLRDTTTRASAPKDLYQESRMSEDVHVALATMWDGP